MNKVILIGNIGRDPAVRRLENGVVIAKFSLATSEYNSSAEKKEHTEWHNLVLWRRLAEYAERRLSKGDKISVEGKLRTRSWSNSEGVQRYTTEIVVSSLNLIIKRESQDKNSTDGSELEDRFNDENFEPKNDIYFDPMDNG